LRGGKLPGLLGRLLLSVLCSLLSFSPPRRPEELLAALAVACTLLADFIQRDAVEAVGHHRVAARVLIDVGGAVADPLAGDEDGHRDMELELDHLKRRGVPVA